MLRSLLLLMLIWIPTSAASGVVAIGGAGRGRGYVAPSHGYPGGAVIVWGPSIELDVDGALGPTDRLGLRLRALDLLPDLVEFHVGVGYRHLFRPGQPARPFFGFSGALVASNECSGNFCAVPGFAGSGEGGVELRLNHRVRLWIWGALFLRYGNASAAFVGMPSVWAGLGW